MRIALSRWGWAFCLLAFGTTAAAEPKVLEPTSAWTLDYGDEKCSLLRDFGALDERGLGLRIDSYGSLVSFRVNLIGDRVPRTRQPFSLINFALPPDTEARLETSALHGRMSDYRFLQFGLSFLPPDRERRSRTPSWRQSRGRLWLLNEETMVEWANPQIPDPQFEAGVDSLLVEMRRGQKLRLNTGPIGPALEAMRTCIDDLRKSWGLDPVEQRTITRQAYPDPKAVKDVMRDFPTNLLFRGINGFIPLRVMVDSSGRATDCVVQLPEVPEEFREAACGNLGTDFSPALDGGGQPIDSFYQTSVIYWAVGP